MKSTRMAGNVVLPDRRERLAPPSNREERERVKAERDQVRRQLTKIEAELRALIQQEPHDLDWRRAMSGVQERKTRLQERVVQLNAWLAGAPLVRVDPVVRVRKWERRLKYQEEQAQLRAETGWGPDSPSIELLRALYADVSLVLAKGLLARSLMNQPLLDAIRAHLQNVNSPSEAAGFAQAALRGERVTEP